jgi:Tfp pilus assembly protein FimT
MAMTKAVWEMISQLKRKMNQKIRNDSPGARRFPAGFTFVELMLVAVLVLVIVVLNVPRIRATFTGLEVYNFSRKTAGLMRYAQSKAIAEGEKTLFVYERAKDPEKNSKFSLARDVISEFPPDKKRIIIDERYSLLIPTKIKIEFRSSPQVNSKDNLITFNPDGSIQGPELLVYNEARKFKIIAQGIIGRVQIIEETGN